MNRYTHKTINTSIKLLKKINIAEYWKIIYISKKSRNNTNEKAIAQKNKAINWYIILTFQFLAYLWDHKIHNLFTLVSIYYLLIMNIFTCFYYHIWNNRWTTSLAIDRKKIINLILSVFYSTYSFAYLYKFYYLNEFSWNKDLSIDLQVFAYGFLGIFGGQFLGVSVETGKGLLFLIFNSLIIFLFVAVVLSSTSRKETSVNK